MSSRTCHNVLYVAIQGKTKVKRGEFVFENIRFRYFEVIPILLQNDVFEVNSIFFNNILSL